MLGGQLWEFNTLDLFLINQLAFERFSVEHKSLRWSLLWAACIVRPAVRESNMLGILMGPAHDLTDSEGRPRC